MTQILFHLHALLAHLMCRIKAKIVRQYLKKYIQKRYDAWI
nr:MAG TPA: hypothetical protein [Bacteriophage sp.]